jgi:hypothetical protein
MAVGHVQVKDKSSRALAERWNGTAWTITPLAVRSGNRETELLDVACVTPTECVAVGDHGAEFGLQPG